MTFRTLLATALLALGAGAAEAGSLSPGDTIQYAVTRPDGSVGHPVVTFLSAAEQRDSNGLLVTRNAAGQRVLNKQWRYRPHDGEFPDSGRITLGDTWSFDIETWQDGAGALRHVRSCQVTDQGAFEVAGMTFPGALKVDCEWTVPGDAAPFRAASTWYWRDDRGFYLLIDSIQQDGASGTVQVALEKITSSTFGTPGY